MFLLCNFFEFSHEPLFFSASNNSSFIGLYITAEIGLPDFIRAIDIQKSSLPLRKDLVPSIGSTIKTLSCLNLE